MLAPRLFRYAASAAADTLPPRRFCRYAMLITAAADA